MKKIVLYLSILLVLGVTNSCIYEKVGEVIDNGNPPDPTPVPPDPGPDPVVKSKNFSFKIYAPLEGDRVETYAIVDMGKRPYINWSISELNLGLFLKGTSNEVLFKNKELEIFSIGNTQGTNAVTVETAETYGIVYGYYPYQDQPGLLENNILNYTLSDVQDQNVADSLMDKALNRNMLMIADPSPSFDLEGGDGLLNLKNIFSILRFRVNISTDYQIVEPIRAIKIYIANKNELETPLAYTLAGNYSIDISKPFGQSGYEGPNFSTTKNVITAKLSNSANIALSTLPSAWLIVNPISSISSNDRLVAVVELDNYKIISSHELPSLNANTVYDIHVVSKRDNTISDNVTIYFADNAASNSYVIPQAGVCQIPLKTINDTDLRGSGYYVDWLWASKEGGNPYFDISELIDPSSIIYDEGSRGVRFRVGTAFGKYTKGNVILALKNSSHEIVWTWHIWLTDRPQDIEYEGGKFFMDRNLGALTANMVSPGVDNYGFVYQWGRKDPFYGSAGSGNETNTNIFSVAERNTIINTKATWAANVAKWDMKSTVGDITHAIKYPMMFICNDNTDNRPADWISMSQPRWSSALKSEYDPCPYGYKVPDRASVVSLHEAARANTDYWYFKFAGNKYWEHYYTSDGVNGDVSVWPAAGMRQGRNSSDGNKGAQLIHSGTDFIGQCFYWTSSAINIGTLSGGSYRIRTSESATLYSEDEYGDNADAYSVRCVKYTP